MSLLEENEAVLRDLADRGAELSKPREVEFAHKFADVDRTSGFATAAVELGFDAELNATEDPGAPWDVICTKMMSISSAEITATETLLSDLAMRFGGEADGWGWLNAN